MQHECMQTSLETACQGGASVWRRSLKGSRASSGRGVGHESVPCRVSRVACGAGRPAVADKGTQGEPGGLPHSNPLRRGERPHRHTCESPPCVTTGLDHTTIKGRSIRDLSDFEQYIFTYYYTMMMIMGDDTGPVIAGEAMFAVIVSGAASEPRTRRARGHAVGPAVGTWAAASPRLVNRFGGGWGGGSGSPHAPIGPPRRRLPSSHPTLAKAAARSVGPGGGGGLVHQRDHLRFCREPGRPNEHAEQHAPGQDGPGRDGDALPQGNDNVTAR